MIAARGSSSSSSALVEAVRQRTGTAAIILSRVDPILVIGSLVAADLYDIEVPIVIVDEGDWHQLAEARHAMVDDRKNFSSYGLSLATGARGADAPATMTNAASASERLARKPGSKPMPARTARANAARCAVRARIKHVFARQTDQMALFIRTIGIARAETRIGLANLAYNLDRLIFHERRAVTG